MSLSRNACIEVNVPLASAAGPRTFRYTLGESNQRTTNVTITHAMQVVDLS